MRNKKGGTLIEVLIYSVIVAALIQSAVLFFHATLNATDRVTERNELLVSQEFIDGKIRWLFNKASEITYPQVGTSSTVFTLSGASSTLFPAIISFSSSSLFLHIPSLSTSSLHIGRVEVVEIKAEHIANPIATSSLKLLLHLRSKALPTIQSSTTLVYTLPY